MKEIAVAHQNAVQSMRRKNAPGFASVENSFFSMVYFVLGFEMERRSSDTTSASLASEETSFSRAASMR